MRSSGEDILKAEETTCEVEIDVASRSDPPPVSAFEVSEGGTRGSEVGGACVSPLEGAKTILSNAVTALF